VKIRNIYFAGAGISASMNQTHTVLQRFPTGNLTSVTDRYANATLPISVVHNTTSTETYYLGLAAGNNTLVVENRRYFLNLTNPGNILQCTTATSPDNYAPGQFPLAAVDGATATHWQPATNTTASLFINLTATTSEPTYKQLSGAYFNWGSRPPINATIFISNSSSESGALYGVETVVSVESISANVPFNATDLADRPIQPVVGNSTDVVFGNDVWSGNYVRLVIDGCSVTDGKGASVGEFVLY
jgi:hypothetical protein